MRLWHISQLLLSLLSCQSYEEIFSRSSLWESDEVPRKTPCECGDGGAKTMAPWVSPSHAGPHLASNSLSKLPFKCSYQFLAQAVSALGKYILVVINLWNRSISPAFGWWFVLQIQTDGSKKVTDLQFVQLFLVIEMGMSTY